jgi:glutamate carboxypeptidase
MDFSAYKPVMMSLLKKLVEIESPTYEKAAVNRLGAAVAREASKLGAAIEIIPKKTVGDQVIARWGSGRGGFLLVGHIDTVFPLGTLDAMPFYEEGDKIFGPGVLDMKAGIVIMLQAIAILQKAGSMPKRPITMFFNTDEETGSYLSRELVKKLAKDIALALVFEPSENLDGSLHTWRKGTGKFHIKVQGRAAHSGGAHQKGLNAIEELSYQIVKVQGLTNYDKGTTINIGSIQGGRAINIVPAYAEADGDIRVIEVDEYKRVEKVIRNLKPVIKEALIGTECILNRPPMPYNELMDTTFKKAQKIAAEEGVNIIAGGSGSASDANFVAEMGIPVLDGMGGVGEGFHSESEYILTQSILDRLELTTLLLRDW